MKTWLAGFCRVGLHSHPPPIAPAPRPTAGAPLSTPTPAGPNEGGRGLAPRPPCLLHEAPARPRHEHRADRVHVLLDLGEVGREVERVEGHPELLHHLTPAVLE